VDRPPAIGITGRSELVHPTFSFPLLGTFETYVRATRRAGGLPLILPPVLSEGEEGFVLSLLDGLILSGGGDVDPRQYGAEPSPLVKGVDADRDFAELALMKEALRIGIPILAICRGIQVLNVALGGTLYQDIPTQLPQSLPHSPPEDEARDASAHPVRFESRSRIAGILNTTEMQVNSFHHQAVEEIGQDLLITARAPDGIIEAVEHATHPFCVAVQWHPEVPIGNAPGMEHLFAAFVAAARG
jgi:putative glutamine amidotransferase